MDIGPMPTSDTRFKRRARMLQAWYRVAVARQLDCGPWSPGEQIVGSSLVDGRSSKANFISQVAFDYAVERVADKAKLKELTIEEDRLFNNMLSSQPMCFNLFTDIRQSIRDGNHNGIAVVNAMFGGEPVSAADITVEHIPVPLSKYIGDKTAFDAALECMTTDGRKRLIAVETKYTDHLGKNKAAKTGRKHELALRIFTPEAVTEFQRKGYDQMARNLLLTYDYATQHGFEIATNVVMALADDQEAIDAVDRARRLLRPEFRDLVAWLPLEEAVRRGSGAAGPELAAHFARFKQRYLDFSQIAHLLHS